MKSNKKIFFGIVMLVAMFGSIGFFVASPKKAEALTMSPIRLELDGDPGSKVEGTIKIHNDDRVKRTFYISKARFESGGESGEPVFVPGSGDGLASWISLEGQYDAGPLEYVNVPFTISIPSNAEPGGYFAAIFATLVPPTPDDISEIALRSEVGTLVLLRVNGEFPGGEKILEFKTKDGKSSYKHVPVEFYFRFQNVGADRAKPLGDITIRNWFGGVTKVITGNRGAGNVLPQSIRRFDSAWVTAGGDKIETFSGDVQQPKISGFWSAVRYEWKNFAFGRYKATLSVVVNNDSSRAHAATLSFWIIPWELLLVIAGALLLLLGLIGLMAGLIVLIVLRRRRNEQPRPIAPPMSSVAPMPPPAKPARPIRPIRPRVRRKP